MTNNRSGNLNPMWGKRHDELAKRKISDSQKERYTKIKRQLQSENKDSKSKEGRTDSQAKIDLLIQCLFCNTIGFRDAQQARNFIAIMSDGVDLEILRKALKDEYEKHLLGA